jgi:hypothetical protein
MSSLIEPVPKDKYVVHSDLLHTILTPFEGNHTHSIASLLKRDDAMHQTEEWNVHIFHAKALKVCAAPQEKVVPQ